MEADVKEWLDEFKGELKEELDKIDRKLEKQADERGAMQTEQALQKKAITDLETKVEKHHESIETNKAFVNRWGGVGYVVSFLALVASAWAAFKQ